MPTQITNLALIICAILSTGAGVKNILNKNRRFSDIVLSFVMFFLAVWSIAIDFTVTRSSELASRALFSSAAIWGACILLYVLSYSPTFNKKKMVPIVAIPIGIIAIITMIPHMVLVSVNTTADGHNSSSYGPFFLIYNLSLLVIAAMSIYSGKKIIPKLAGNAKIELRYTATSLAIGAVFATSSNIILPSLGNSDFVAFGPIAMLALVAGTSYGLSRHRLLGAQVIVSELLSITLMLVVLVWLFVNFSLFNFVLYACVILISFMFIRTSVIEAKERIVIEKKEKQLEKDKIELQSLDKLKDEFIKMATHELSSPLAVINAKLSMVFDEKIYKFNGKDEQFLKPIYISSRRASDLFKKIIQVVNLESSSFTLLKEESGLIDLAKEVVESNHVFANMKEVEIKTSFTTNGLKGLRVDVTKLKQVMDSLIKNAITFSNPNSIVRINLVQDKQKAIFSVSDKGRGIQDEAKKHIFEKFYQSERFDENNPIEQQGSGLSLFIAKKIIELHGGEIWFESESGKGSTFYFSLPLGK